MFHRRQLLQMGAAGVSLPAFLALRESVGMQPAPAGFGRAKRCIVLFAWGGMSHVDTWDPKPDGPDDVRGEFGTIDTQAPGIRLSEHMGGIARHTHRLAIVRSVHHKTSDHRKAAYWNLTGHAPRSFTAGVDLPSNRDWPSIGSQVARARSASKPDTLAAGMTVSLPYAMADRGILNGQYAGFLGSRYEPVFARPKTGKDYSGVSPSTGVIQAKLPKEVNPARFAHRQQLLAAVEGAGGNQAVSLAALHEQRYREMAVDLLTGADVSQAFDTDREPAQVRDAYGDHICGQSVLLARRLVEADIPLVTVCCAAGDLNGSVGSHWDTHGDNFNRLKRDMLPPLNQASAALLADLAERGLLEETLVVWLTEFGRTPKIKGSGRDHYPSCYSVAFAGGGVQGGQVYGRSNKLAAEPAESACVPDDLQATILHALGIDPQFAIVDHQGRPHPLTRGTPLGIF